MKLDWTINVRENPDVAAGEEFGAYDDDVVFWPRCFWIDPGVTTGVSVVWFDPVLLLDRTQPILRSVMGWWGANLHGTENSQTADICNITKRWGGEAGLGIGVEDFILQSSNKSRDLLSPVRMTARIDFALWRGLKEHDGEVRKRAFMARQMPVDAMRVITDDRLRLWDMYVPGPDHLRDATRHSMLWLRRLRAEGYDFLARCHGWNSDWYRS